VKRNGEILLILLEVSRAIAGRSPGLFQIFPHEIAETSLSVYIAAEARPSLVGTLTLGLRKRIDRMPSKRQLQTTLKEKYGINKNITQSLSLEDCEALLLMLHNQPSAVRLVDSFIGKNDDLAKDNRIYGLRRKNAEQKLEGLKRENEQLEQSIAELEKSNGTLGDRKQLLSQEQAALEAQIQQLTAQNQNLSSKVQKLSTDKDELIEANDELKRDNKELKNLVDQIRLRLAHDTKMLLQYEDSEIRKAMIRLFRWTLG
jgi:DNA repair exonuclease SbcCD ATPase subunit